MTDATGDDADALLDPLGEGNDLTARLDRLFAASPTAEAGEPLSPLGRQIGNYVVERMIGHGSFGVVYQARHTQLGRDVALKLPRPEVLVDMDRLDRFQSEAATAASLDHPAIVPIYEAQLAGPTPFIASALCVGPDLRKWLDSRLTPPPVTHAAALIAELADAVQHAHDHGVLHRDLKPGNVLLEPHDHESTNCLELTECEPRLTDFGLARFLDGGLTQTRSSLLIGTPLYMAPEQLGGEARADQPVIDVYALGVLLYELLTLRTPFEGTSYVEVLDKLRSGEPESVRRLNPAAPRDLVTVCHKCLRREAEGRYQSAGELRDDLERFLDGDPVLAKPATIFDRFGRWTRLPARIRQAGLFTFWAQIAITAWMAIVGVIAMTQQVMPQPRIQETALDVLFISVSFHIPLALVGWMIAKGRRWAFAWGALGSVVWVGVLANSAFEPAIDFEYNYTTPLSKLNTFVALMLGGLVQSLMYVLATPAWLHQGRRTED